MSLLNSGKTKTCKNEALYVFPEPTDRYVLHGLLNIYVGTAFHHMDNNNNNNNNNKFMYRDLN